LVVCNDADTPVVNWSKLETFTAASLDDVTLGVAVNPFDIIEITVSNDELTLPVIWFDIDMLGNTGVTDDTLIDDDVFDLKSKEPVPFENILKIAPNDLLISFSVSNDADANDDVICSAPKILYGDSNPYPLLELLANRVGKFDVPFSTIVETNLKSDATSSIFFVVG
jgi:hypothetical protein